MLLFILYPLLSFSNVSRHLSLAMSLRKLWNQLVFKKAIAMGHWDKYIMAGSWDYSRYIFSSKSPKMYFDILLRTMGFTCSTCVNNQRTRENSNSSMTKNAQNKVIKLCSCRSLQIGRKLIFSFDFGPKSPKIERKNFQLCSQFRK